MDDISGNETYEAATANWGSTWRMPTKAECQELVDDCTYTWTTQTNPYSEEITGYKVEGTNGNSIFLPATGNRYGSSLYYAGTNGLYWSSTHSADDAYALYFISGYHRVRYGSRRYCGRSVRPVSE